MRLACRCPRSPCRMASTPTACTAGASWRAARSRLSCSRSWCRWPSRRLRKFLATTEASRSNRAEVRWRSSGCGRRVLRRSWRSSCASCCGDPRRRRVDGGRASGHACRHRSGPRTRRHGLRHYPTAPRVPVLHQRVNHGSQVGEQALKYFGRHYGIEREVAYRDNERRREIRRQRSRLVADALHQWLGQQRQKVPDGSATAKGIDYSLNRCAALTRYIDDGELPVDNNWGENQIRPIALGRNNWAVRRVTARGLASRRDDDRRALGAAGRARSLGLPQGPAGPVAHAAGRPHPGAAAAPIANCIVNAT